MDKQSFFITQTRLGLIHSLLLRDVKRWLDEQAKSESTHKVLLYDVRRFVENKAITLMKDRQGQRYKNIFNCMAFPVGVNRNNVAAHYSPRDWEDEWFDLRRDSVSIDFGLMDPSNGVLTDGAFTWNGLENTECIQLSDIAKGVVDHMIAKSGPDVILGELGKECQEYVGSKEVVIEGKEEYRQVTTIKDLCGHKIAPYVIHAGKAVPSVHLPTYKMRMEEEETYAIEVFPTTGNGKSYEVPISKQVPSHLALCGNVMDNMKSEKRQFVAKLMSIASTRRYVPFDPEWYSMSDSLIKGGIEEKMWKAYPAIKTQDDSPVVQWEKMIRVQKRSGVKILVQA